MPDRQPSQTSNACLTCRKQKRKCSREVPRCFVCRKTGRTCDYTPVRKPASPISSAQTESDLGPDNSSTEPGTSSGLTTLFLDCDVPPERSYLETNRHALPSEFLRFLRSPGQVRHEVDVYFNSVHVYLPIVSKLRLYRQLSDLQEPDLGLLLLAMQLHVRPCNEVDALYRAVKACHAYVESRNVFTIKLVQAGLLIALYEIAHAIYPAAYLTVGHCARLGHALGIHRSEAPQLIGRLGTWVELEERRRTWWAVIILDRYVNLGGRHRPFACEDAQPEDLLPADDKHWDRGEITVVEPLAVRANTTIQVCPYTRTCQAAHTLGRVLGHINDRTSDTTFRDQEALQLHRTSQALLHTLSADCERAESDHDTASLPLYTALSLTYSALLILYDKYSCSGLKEFADNPELQKTTLAGLMEVAQSVSQFAGRILSAMELGGSLKTSPLVLDCLYQAAANLAWQGGRRGGSSWCSF
ncbi:hypothetical protein BDV25DRAFT_147711 [Aspergillus avenaceus]|uniref:Zn(2)-C6 fungal-type domain-containing protein n=1 Tax=Aspergillus avenaceus TaxID=36643 RepID=A0A5N6U798_ASPAV|nr:hypothetical protein BDV25DRAFT_147711 [Aspergillus avenaceus]